MLRHCVSTGTRLKRVRPKRRRKKRETEKKKSLLTS